MSWRYFSFVLVGWFSSLTLGMINIPVVSIGNVGNLADATGYGGVGYRYNIGTNEVTNAEYTAFLNAVAATDTNGLYTLDMTTDPLGGITRSGSAGSYSYASKPGRANYPVNFVGFYDAARFANWLHNGQPVGAQSAATTEDGAYALTPGAIAANTVSRKPGWQWAVTSENEWYKAAYYQPSSQGGDLDNYWLYPTSTNTMNPGLANYGTGTDARPVGSYSANFYGTYDMGGNLYEWNDAIIVGTTGSYRGLRGGQYDAAAFYMESNYRYPVGNPGKEHAVLGFRVSQIPTPGGGALMLLTALSSVTSRRRDRGR